MNSVDQVVSTLRSAVLSGTYAAGAPLPSARDLSRELRANKNTVSKAFGVLAEEGLLDVSRGRRARVVGTPARPEVTEQILRRQLHQALMPVFREARFLGIQQNKVTQTIQEELDHFYRAAAVRLCLVECNRIDGQQLAKELAALLAMPIEWALLEEAKTNTADIFVVPYYHLDDVARRRSGTRVVGIHVAPDPEVLLELLESLRSARSVALICGNPRSAQRFARLFAFYTNKEIPIVHYRDRRATDAVLRTATKMHAAPKIFATAEAFGAIEERMGRNKPILFRERIDPNSLGPLRLLLRGSHESGAGANGDVGRRRRSGARVVTASR